MKRESDPGDVELIVRYPILREITPRLDTLFRSECRPIAVRAGTVVFDVGSPCTGLPLLTRGSIRVVRIGHNGREIMLYRVRPGESCILSASCLLGRLNYSARGVVDSDLTGVSIPPSLFETLVAESVPFRTFIFDLFGARIATLMQLVEEVAFHRLDQRLAAHLVRCFHDAGGMEIVTTHQDLADQVGSVREIVSRVLESFEHQGAISLARSHVTLVRPGLLEEIAGGLAR